MYDGQKSCRQDSILDSSATFYNPGQQTLSVGCVARPYSALLASQIHLEFTSKVMS
jgi:hypothetical protein